MSRVPFYKGRPRHNRRTLDQAQVVRAAIALLDEVGLDELTMRRLAERLDGKGAPLFRPLRDKEGMLALLGDEVSAEDPLPPRRGTWREQLAASAWNVRRGLLAHRDAARVLASTPPAGPRRLRHIEALLRILGATGLTDRDATRAAYHLNNLVTEFAADEGRLAAYAAATRSSPRQILSEMRRQFRSLPNDEYPSIVALADCLAEDAQDVLFEFGLNLCLRG